jgi:hypothetical protein
MEKLVHHIKICQNDFEVQDHTSDRIRFKHLASGKNFLIKDEILYQEEFKPSGNIGWVEVCGVFYDEDDIEYSWDFILNNLDIDVI